MATSVQSRTWTNADDASFRAWGSAISAGLAAVGLVKVAVTGAVDWGTVVRGTSVASGTPWGFEVWRFDDALQATHPVFIKVEYGGSNSTNASQALPALWVTVSRGVDAAGNPVNILAPRRACQPNITPSSPSANRSSIEPIFVSSDGSSICVVPRTGAVAAGVHAPAFIVDRSRDNTGTPTSAGGVILTEGAGQPTTSSSSSSIASPAQMHAWTYAGDSWMGDVPAVCPSSVNGSAVTASTSLAVGDKAPVFPLVVTVPNHEPWQVLAAVTVLAGDAANGPFAANVLGRIRNYRSIPVSDAHCRWMSGTSALGYTGLCILWEED